MLFALLLAAAPAISWQHFDSEVFARAKAGHKLVLLDVEAVWCHWCHVMDEVTYSSPAVRAEISAHYLAVRVDQDADPAISRRYQQWGWPATILLDANGSELVKRRGYIEPVDMAMLLSNLYADPKSAAQLESAPLAAQPSVAGLTQEQREKLRGDLIDDFDSSAGGFGDGHKYIEAAPLEAAAALSRAGDHRFDEMLAKTLDAGLKLIDRPSGAIDQYSATRDWNSPHFEKLTSSQAEGLRSYSLGYALLHDKRYLEAARGIASYLSNFLSSPDGAFYASQDADVSAALDGAKLARMSAAARRKLKHGPKIDQHVYTELNGRAIAALASYSDATGMESALERATRAARWILVHRALSGGGFMHGEALAPSSLGDDLEMGRAFLALYRSTGAREWLRQAEESARYIDATFASPEGYLASKAGGVGVFAKPIAEPDQNAELARFANLLSHYSGDAADRSIAEKALRSAAHALSLPRPLPKLLLADMELSSEPLHVTVVGPKSDMQARALVAAARAIPATYARIEWWDPAEGPLPHDDVALPRTGRPAAYVCTGGSCSLPLHDPSKIAASALRE